MKLPKFKLNWKNILLFSIAVLAIVMLIRILSTTSLRAGEPEMDLEEMDPIEIESLSINRILENDEFENPESKDLDRYIQRFLKKWEINGASLAIYKNGALRFAKGYGWANKEDSVKMNPGHILRIASLSKLITASAIMKMAEDSLLSLKDKVFGAKGILNDDCFLNYADRRVREITVENLLRHQGGFTPRNGDPLFMSREIIIWNDLDSIPTSDQIIQFALKYRLAFRPGTSSCYSNLGYLILSRIIEKKSGMKYEEYCQKNILYPAGCYDMHIGRNYYEERFPNEVRYYETRGAELVYAYDNSGQKVSRIYGGNDIIGLQGAGGWVSSPAEFSLLISHLDRDTASSDILSEESIRKMMNCRGGRMPIGWSKGSLNGDWTRTGSLAGTSAVAKKFKDGSIWVFITNTSAWKGSRFTRNIDYLLRKGKGMLSDF